MDTVFPRERWGEEVKQLSTLYVSFLLFVSQILLYLCMANFSVERKYNIKTVQLVWNEFHLNRSLLQFLCIDNSV